MMGPVFRSRRGRLALLPPRAVRAQSLGRLPLLLPSPTLQRAALGPDALVCPVPRAGFYAIVMSVAGVSTVGCMVRWMAYFFARVILSEVLSWMAPPGSPPQKTYMECYALRQNTLETKRKTTRMSSTTMSTTTWGLLVPTTTATTYDI
ncbi:hypothetical protein GMDG_04572 [Pseudogymnoascus destructans 20631-21]|uniref:Uncharacterized protein n=1 Tax=Pseudogymnoascus destructans (strain ATCC MYA-4855 / 20631-21) TaxID=658429 RepID=L8GBE4_PSED2|nr:hypothetical protein GMDG_04572 [Pseudogymnoascus destructans 20631-21]